MLLVPSVKHVVNICGQSGRVYVARTHGRARACAHKHGINRKRCLSNMQRTLHDFITSLACACLLCEKDENTRAAVMAATRRAQIDIFGSIDFCWRAYFDIGNSNSM